MNVFGVGPTEIIVVLIVILVLFGPDRLPELAKKIGGASREIRESLNTINDQMNTALETSMEVDKAKMTPPQTTPAIAASTEPENLIMPPQVVENSIVPINPLLVEPSSDSPIQTSSATETIPSNETPPTTPA